MKRPGKNSFEAEIEKFDQPYKDRGLAGILCMGMDPGAVNVFARWAMDRLDTASSIRVLDADNAEVRGYRFAVLFSPETFFEELGAVPYFVKDGRVSSGKPLETEVEWVRFPEPIGLQKTYAVAHEEGVSLGIYPPFVEKGVRYSVFKYSIPDKVVHISKSLALLNLDTWKKVRVDGVEVAPVRVASASLPKPAQLGATVDGYSCVGTEVRGTKDRRRVEYFVYSMDSHRDTYEKYGYSLTVVQTGIPPALTARLLATGKIPERGVMMPEHLDPEELMANFSREGLPIFVEKRESSGCRSFRKFESEGLFTCTSAQGRRFYAATTATTMSQHPSLKGSSAITAKRSVLKRFERVELMKKRGQFKEASASSASRRRSPRNRPAPFPEVLNVNRPAPSRPSSSCASIAFSLPPDSGRGAPARSWCAAAAFSSTTPSSPTSPRRSIPRRILSASAAKSCARSRTSISSSTSPRLSLHPLRRTRSQDDLRPRPAAARATLSRRPPRHGERGTHRADERRRLRRGAHAPLAPDRQGIRGRRGQALRRGARPELLRGVTLESGRARMESVHPISPTKLKVILRQGLKRQIREMLWRVGGFNVESSCACALARSSIHV